ncbi:ER membrane protein complex subunit 5 [Amyelois transitella]|uniref:ER membrane protein complex subunit 5 n=1 Tax=Amyelois transitella TaxID=680683 RepID=UPI00067CEAE7|nr:ER membrane protein complex subunit 5 [Amyelois transitella]XP_013192962.1 ER membrane protein complex subunit 5 [Amyelois transitella]
MASSFNKIILIVGFISLFHSAFSAAQHRSYLRITSQEFTTLPLDIVVQAVVSLFAIMWGVLNIAGNLREIRAAAELNQIQWETQRNLPSFYIFSHRGKFLSAPDPIDDTKFVKQ